MNTFKVLGVNKKPDISFNGFSLSNDNIRINSTNFYSLPDRSISSYCNPRWDGGRVAFASYSGRKIEFTWTVFANSKDEFDILLDNIKKYCNWIEWYLDIKSWNAFRRTKCTMESFVPEINNYNINFCNFKISFVSFEPYFYELQDTAILFENLDKTFVSEFNNLWKDKSFPSLYVIFKEVKGSSKLKFGIWEEKIEIHSEFKKWDLLEVNWLKEEVLHNYQEINYNWIFPHMMIDYNDVSFELDWDFKVDLYLLYKKTYK